MENSGVLFGVLITAIILFVLIWILGVADFIKLRQWVGLHACSKSRQRVGYWALRRTERMVLELRLSDLLVRAREERSRLLGCRSRLAEEVLARVLEWVTEGVALELAKGLLGALALVDCHALVEADLVTLLAESLVAGAGVASIQTRWHGEESIALPVIKNKRFECLRRYQDK